MNDEMEQVNALPLEEIFPAVREWANNKSLTDPHKQFKKHSSETGEVGDALCRDDMMLFIDGIGDSVVTTTNVANACRINIEAEVLKHARQFQITGTLDEVFYELAELTLTETPLSEDSAFEVLMSHVGFTGLALATANQGKLPGLLVATMLSLNQLAHLKGTNLGDCLRFAWDEIRDRTGLVKDGVFVKSEDLVNV